jgi:hypothetical protein
MQDALRKADLYRKKAAKYSELATGANAAYLGDFCRGVAVRYLFMAEDESRQAKKQGNTNPEVSPDARRIAQDFDFLSQLAGIRLHSQ